jgi:dolichol-phosphate mannosyltransferase
MLGHRQSLLVISAGAGKKYPGRVMTAGNAALSRNSNNLIMSTQYKKLITVFAYNEGEKLEAFLSLLKTVTEENKIDVLVVDDGSTDSTQDTCKKYPFAYIKHSENTGIGSSIRDAIKYGLKNNYDIMAPASGNGKTQPEDLVKFINSLIDDGFDFIKGSRYLEGGESRNLPLFRHVMIKTFSMIVSLFMLKRITDVTCLIGAYKLNIFNDSRIDIDQEWLNRYEMEFYILYKVIKYKYRIKEVPASIIYPEVKKNYSKIKPFSGWWLMIRPWIFLILGIKK